MLKKKFVECYLRIGSVPSIPAKEFHAAGLGGLQKKGPNTNSRILEFSDLF